MEQENKEITINQNIKTLPLVALRGKVVLPKTILNFDVGRNISVNAVENALKNGSDLLLCAQKNLFIDAPKEGDINTVGVLAHIKQAIKVTNGNMKLSVDAYARAKVLRFTDARGFFEVEAIESPYVELENDNEKEAYLRVAKSAFIEYALTDKRITKEMSASISAIDTPNEFMDNALSVAPFKDKSIQEMLDLDSTEDRLKKFQQLFFDELEIAKIEKKITASVRASIDKGQKEYYLREQLKAIHVELGDGEESQSLTKQIKEKGLPKDIEEKALKEISRLDKINPSSPDYSVILNYLDWLKDLPFGVYTKDTDSLTSAKEILDKDHFGLEKVKERIVEYLAVLQLTKEIKGPILCFVGPPGVGKTSVATSIARALNRKFVRMSLGGVKDEAEIRGHRKTYVGAMPGRIIYGIKNAGSMNPVFLLDEIDKLSSDIHGDPASALLEVLDPEQNSTFRDRFLEVPFDLSKVMFITTANSIETIPYPLLDRMEIIEINGYTNQEKLEIAKRYLIPKQIVNNGLSEKKVEILDDAITEVIESYTMEAGVRNLERELSGIIRKIATCVAESPKTRKQVVTKENVKNYLGVKKYIRGDALLEDEIGAATGLAWTSVGGTTLTIEVSLFSGKGEILLTGKLGDVMKESARAAISYIHSNAKKFNIDESLFSTMDIHIHVPEGATPKDGPSAGITMATAILSAFTKKPVKSSVAMTGEITLRGKVLGIGGLKEKVLAAYRQGIKTIIIPEYNKKDLVDIPSDIRGELKFVTVKNVEEVFKKAIRF